MSYAGSSQAAEILTSFQVFNALETPSGAIFCTDGGHFLQVSTDDGRTWAAVPGSSGIQFRTDSMNINALGEVLVGTIAATPTIYYCTPSGITQATGIGGIPNTAFTRFARGYGALIYAMNDNDAVMHKSLDHGHSWTNFAPNYPATIGQVYAAEINAYGLMVGGEIGKCYVSGDGGSTWTDWGLSHPSVRAPTDYHGNLWNFATSPITGTVFAAIGDPDVPGLGMIQRHVVGAGVGVWTGVTGMRGSGAEQVNGWVWQADGSILSGAIYSTPGTGQVYKSTNDGASWTEISSQIGAIFTGLVRLHIGPSGRLYISDNNRLIRRHRKGY